MTERDERRLVLSHTGAPLTGTRSPSCVELDVGAVDAGEGAVAI